MRFKLASLAALGDGYAGLVTLSCGDRNVLLLDLRPFLFGKKKSIFEAMSGIVAGVRISRFGKILRTEKRWNARSILKNSGTADIHIFSDDTSLISVVSPRARKAGVARGASHHWRQPVMADARQALTAAFGGPHEGRAGNYHLLLWKKNKEQAALLVVCEFERHDEEPVLLVTSLDGAEALVNTSALPIFESLETVRGISVFWRGPLCFHAPGNQK
jgi:hypothetical protein